MLAVGQTLEVRDGEGVVKKANNLDAAALGQGSRNDRGAGAFALPMGLLDALVPFGSYNIDAFEAVVFLLSLGFLFVAAKSLSKETKVTATASTVGPPAAHS